MYQHEIINEQMNTIDQYECLVKALREEIKAGENDSDYELVHIDRLREILEDYI